jgi:hypothetical protein
MRFKVLLAAGLLVVALQAVNARPSPRWYRLITQIKLLSSNYHDVVKLLGRPEDGSSEPELAEYFQLKEGRIFVAFASGDCVESEGRLVGWKVPQWTVISVTFEPRRRITIMDLPFSLTGFVRHPVHDVPGAFTFENEIRGLSVGVKRSGNIEDISFDPSADLANRGCN